MTEIVHIAFLDHVEDGDEPMRCHVYGELIKEEVGYIIVRGWAIEQDDVSSAERSNVKDWVIVRAAIGVRRSLYSLDEAKRVLAERGV
jgi:hypothetical protein